MQRHVTSCNALVLVVSGTASWQIDGFLGEKWGPRLTVEYSNELYGCTCDKFLQLLQYYAGQRHHQLRDPEDRVVRTTCCPSFIMEVLGPNLRCDKLTCCATSLAASLWCVRLPRLHSGCLQCMINKTHDAIMLEAYCPWL